MFDALIESWGSAKYEWIPDVTTQTLSKAHVSHKLANAILPQASILNRSEMLSSETN